ncbi:MAG: hypothetical protein AAGA31_06305 [Bacteroidota bacterium]
MNENDYIAIEAYLQGEADQEARAALEKRATEDVQFAAALAERRQLNDHLKARGKEPDLRNTLDQLGKKYFQSKETPVRKLRPQKRKLWQRLAIAAAIALVVSLGITFLWPSKGTTYEQFAQHQPISLTERGTGDELASQAEAAFNQERYAESADLLERYLQEQAEDQQAKLALGISLLESNQDSAAVNVFQEIAESGSSLAPYGNWYLALAAVKRGKNAEALKFLDLIPATDTYLKARADRLRATL